MPGGLGVSDLGKVSDPVMAQPMPEPRTANCWRSGLRKPPTCCTCGSQKYPDALALRLADLGVNLDVLAFRHPDTFENRGTRGVHEK